MPVSTLIPPNCDVFVVRLMMIPLDPGALEITGIKVTMFGSCLEEILFPIQTHPFHKLRFKNGQPICQPESDLRFKPVTDTKKAKSTPAPSWKFKIVPVQPMLEINENSLGYHKAVRLFQGEKSVMTMKIRNISSVKVNYAFIKVSEIISGSDSDKNFYDSNVYQPSIRACYLLDDQDSPRSSVESMKLSNISNFTKIGVVSALPLSRNIAPGEEILLTFGLYGKRDCTGCKILLNYGFVGENVSNETTLLTRELEFQLTMTVVPALALENFDMIPTRGLLQDMPSAAIYEKEGMESVENGILDHELFSPRLSTTQDKTTTKTSIFLLTFDIRNDWEEPFKLEIDIYNDSELQNPTTSTTAILHSGVTKRIILPISKIMLTKDEYSKPLPALPGKQFVVSDSGPDEFINRALFWYRQELIGGLEKRGKLVMRWKFVR